MKLQNSHSVKAGRTLINRIEAQIDKRRKIMEDMVIKHGMLDCINSKVYVVNKGRYQGLCAALAILRSSSVNEEMQRSNERLGIDDE